MQRFHSMGLGLTVAIAAFGGSPLTTYAAESVPVVIELFTSQGCSSCPPANANLIELSKGPRVLTLSFAVTYWDYLGWKDSFGKKEFTDRQIIYEPALGKSGPFTPQMVINGKSTAVGNDLDEVKQLVARAARLDGPTVSLDKHKVVLGEKLSRVEPADVWLVHYDPNLVHVPVGRGENTGRTLPHVHVVHSLARLGSWTGAAVSYELPVSSGRWKTAVLVQQKDGRAILSVATD